MIKIILCDDDLSFLQYFKQRLWEELISMQYNDFRIMTYSSEFQSIDYDCDILFMDINMPEISGFDLVKKIKQRENIILVFTSSYEDKVFESFAFSPFDFLRKSFLDEELHNKLKRIMCYYFSKHRIYHFNYSGMTLDILLSDIVYIEKQINNLILVTKDVVLHERKNLSAILSELDESFYKLNRSIIINFNHVKDIKKNAFLMSNNKLIYFKINHRQEAIKMYYNYICRQ